MASKGYSKREPVYRSKRPLDDVGETLKASKALKDGKGKSLRKDDVEGIYTQTKKCKKTSELDSSLSSKSNSTDEASYDSQKHRLEEPESGRVSNIDQNSLGSSDSLESSSKTSANRGDKGSESDESIEQGIKKRHRNISKKNSEEPIVENSGSIHGKSRVREEKRTLEITGFGSGQLTYVRTRHNNLRCFPGCLPTHRDRSFCGLPILAKVGAFSEPEAKKMVVVGTFKKVSDKYHFELGTEMSTSSIAKLLGPDCTFGIMTTYDSLKNIANYKLAPARKWRYTVESTRAGELHAFTVYVFSHNGGRLLARKNSPCFTIVPAWRQSAGEISARAQAASKASSERTNDLVSSERSRAPEHAGYISRHVPTESTGTGYEMPAYPYSRPYYPMYQPEHEERTIGIKRPRFPPPYGWPIPARGIEDGRYAPPPLYGAPVGRPYMVPPQHYTAYPPPSPMPPPSARGVQAAMAYPPGWPPGGDGRPVPTRDFRMYPDWRLEGDAGGERVPPQGLGVLPVESPRGVGTYPPPLQQGAFGQPFIQPSNALPPGSLDRNQVYCNDGQGIPLPRRIP